MKQAVARFIERLGLKAIILHEQPSASKTVIEKLEEYSNVGYVVVLLSPDDVGASQRSARELHPRPRQNVVFEMGFFVGKLTRGRVCAIVKDKVEIHSDIQGVVYIPMDDKGAWQFALTKELKRAGFEVSLDVLA
jgi:predicted nucleotide-binding protein